MWRMLPMLVLGVVLSPVPAQAQKPADSEEVKHLQAVLDKLRQQIKEVEARLDKARQQAAAKKPAARPMSPWADFDPEKAKEMRERFEKRREQARKEGKPFGPMWGGRLDPEKAKAMREQFEKMRAARKQGGADKKSGKGEASKATPRFNPQAFKGRGPWGGRAGFGPAAGKGPGGADLESRLDRLAKELESIRAELKAKN